MAVIAGYPKELRQDRRGGADNAQYTYARKFQVITDTATDGPNVALLASGIPRVGDVHPYVAFASVTRLSVDADNDSPFVFYVTADYETPPRTGNTGDDNPNPLLRPAQYSWSFATQSEPVEFGVFKNVIKVKFDGTEQVSAFGHDVIKRYPIVNSAKEKFDPLPERQASYPMLRVTRNQAGFSAADATAYVDHVNSDVFGIAGNLAQPGQALMASITANRAFENNVFYWEVTYEIHYRKNGWTVVALDRGDKERRNVTPPGGGAVKWKLFPITAQGSQVHGALLDGLGKQLEVKETPAPTDIIAVYLEYQPYETAVFSSLLL